jgi:protein-S-isoprenylcysteine O-methyltransferase Ste14
MVRRLDGVMRERTWRSFIALVVRHPSQFRSGYQLVVAKKVWPELQKLESTRKLSSLIFFTIRHPIFAALYVWPGIKINFSSKKAQESKEGDEPEEPLKDLEAHDGAWVEDVLEPIEEADALFLDRQLVSAAEREQDAHLFGGRDREWDGFVRLVLRESYHDLFVPGKGEHYTEEVVFEPRLFLHWTGVAILTVQISTDSALTTRELIELMWGPAPRIARSRMAEPLVKGTWLEPLVTHWEDSKRDAGARLAMIEWERDGLSMSDFLHSQMQLITRTVGARFRHSLTYPVSIIQAGDCCPPGAFQTVHADDITRVTMRMMTDRRLAPHVDREPDWSSTADHSLFVNLGSSSYFQWEGERPFGIPELQTTLVIEYGLSLYKRLEAMEEDVSRMRLGDRRLRRRYRNAILLFSELRQGDVRAGTARAIVRHLIREMGADEMRPTIESALNLASMAHGTVSAERSSRRSWWLALVGTVVAAIVSFPTISDMLASLQKVPTDSDNEWALRPLRDLASLGVGGPWAVIGIVVALLLGLWLLGTIFRVWPRLRLDPGRGYLWPTPFHVVYEEPHEADDEVGATKRPDEEDQ